MLSGLLERKELPWLSDRTIFLATSGSRAYGTHRPDSDTDYRGICIPPAQYRDGFLMHFEQAEWKKPSPDAVIYGIQKFFKLAADCNPNVLEILWVDYDAVHKVTNAGRTLIEHRDLFLSQKVLHTFRGYAMSQLKRIKTHRKWLISPPTRKPTRADFNLPERTKIPKEQLEAAQAAIQKRLDSWEIDYDRLDKAGIIYIQEQITRHLTELHIGLEEKRTAAGRLLGYDDNFLEYLGKERQYQVAKRNWDSYLNWKSARNPQRAAMEAAFGYDGKHALHLVRLMRMCREILKDGAVLVRRPDAEELKQFLTGYWSYEDLMLWAEKQDVELLDLAKTSPLPHKPDRVALDQLCRKIVRSVHDAWDK